MAFDSGQVMNTMDLVKRAWSSLNVPTPFTPTLSVEEIDKRITDLRAVEQWLALNQNLLRTTIQGLEIQRGTLNAINAMTDSFGKAVQPDESMAQALAQFAAAAAAGHAAGAPAPEAPGPTSTTSSSGPSSGSAPASAGWLNPFLSSSAPADSAVPPAPGPEAPWKAEDVDQTATAPAASAAQPAAAASLLPGKVDLMQAAGINPMAWWSLLQNNFQQIAEAATTAAVPPAPAPAAEPKPAGKPRKRRTKTAAPAAATAPAREATKVASKGSRRRRTSGEP